MDDAPAFSSDVMRAFYSIMGVKHVDVSAPDDPTHHSTVERRNAVMEKMIDVAVSKGDLNTADDLHMYCAAATAACNLEYVYEGHTLLEYLTGEVPRIRNALASPPEIPPILGSLDSAFMTQLASLLVEQHGLLHYLRDDDARYSQLLRDAHAQRAVTTSFDLKPGDSVSYGGSLYVLLDMSVSTPTSAAKAVVRDATHAGVLTRTVKYSDLRPLASHRPVHMHSKWSTPAPVRVGDFVFCSMPDSPKVEAGTVVDLPDDGFMTVHEHRQAPVLKRRFVPLYFNSDTESYEPRVVTHDCHIPATSRVPVTSVHVAGEISDTRMIAQHMLDSLHSLGVFDE